MCHNPQQYTIIKYLHLCSVRSDHYIIQLKNNIPLESITSVKHRMLGFGEIRLAYIYLAKTTGSSISISITYIVFFTKLQKKANPAKRICPIENCTYAIRAKMSDISQVFEVDDIFIFWMAI